MCDASGHGKCNFAMANYPCKLPVLVNGQFTQQARTTNCYLGIIKASRSNPEYINEPDAIPCYGGLPTQNPNTFIPDLVCQPGCTLNPAKTQCAAPTTCPRYDANDCTHQTPPLTGHEHITGVTGRHITVAHTSHNECIDSMGNVVANPQRDPYGNSLQQGVTCGGGTSGPGYQTGANTKTQHGAVRTQLGCSKRSPSRLLPLVRGSDP
jgi:hypothetical protein